MELIHAQDLDFAFIEAKMFEPSPDVFPTFKASDGKELVLCVRRRMQGWCPVGILAIGAKVK